MLLEFVCALLEDLSEAACLQASANAILHEVHNRSRIVVSNWFSHVDDVFDLIVSNPPYISRAEMPGLAPEVREHEPDMALTDGADGLSAYRKICAGVRRFLAVDGRLVLEIGPTQGEAVVQICRDAGFADVDILPDLDGRDRVVLARRPE